MKLKLILGLCVLLPVAAIAAPAPIVQPSAAVLEIKGDVTKPGTWTLQRIQALAPAVTVKTTFKGKPCTVKGVPLRALIDAAVPKLDTKTKHSESRFVVLARGRDDYLSAFAWPELLPEVGAKNALLIWEFNGQPLDTKDGPLRLAVPGEKKPMRWVYGLTAIELYDAKRLTAKQ